MQRRGNYGIADYSGVASYPAKNWDGSGDRAVVSIYVNFVVFYVLLKLSLGLADFETTT